MMYIMTSGKFLWGPKPTLLAHTALSKMVPKIKGKIGILKSSVLKALLLNLGKI